MMHDSNNLINRSPRSPRAFTLFELLICVVIIGIVALAIMPAVGANWRSPRLKTAANVLAADIEYCASECIAQPNAPRSISFDIANNKYTILDSNAGTAIKYPGDGTSYINDFSTGRNVQLSGVTLTSVKVGSNNLTTLTFDQYGKPQITGDLKIKLTYTGQTLTITVKSTTGDVSIN